MKITREDAITVKEMLQDLIRKSTEMIVLLNEFLYIESPEVKEKIKQKLDNRKSVV